MTGFVLRTEMEMARSVTRTSANSPITRCGSGSSRVGPTTTVGSGSSGWPGGSVTTSSEPAMSKPRLICRHCKKCNVNRPRGLCWGCYYTPGIKELYPSTSPLGRRGLGLGNRKPKPTTPTTHPPGTPGKAEVLRRRAERGEEMNHPKDAKEQNGDQIPRRPHDRSSSGPEDEPDPDARDGEDGWEEDDI